MTDLSAAKDRYLEQNLEMVPTSPHVAILVEDEERASLTKTSEAGGESSTGNAGFHPFGKAPLEGKMAFMSKAIEKQNESFLVSHFLKHCRYIMEVLLGSCIDSKRTAATGWCADSSWHGRPQQ